MSDTGTITEEMRTISTEALRREEVRLVAELEISQLMYDTAERHLANRKRYLELVRKDLAILTGLTP